MYVFVRVLYGIPLHTLMNKKSCLYVFVYNSTICDKLHGSDEFIKGPVLAYANTYATLRDIVANVPGEST